MRTPLGALAVLAGVVILTGCASGAGTTPAAVEDSAVAAFAIDENFADPDVVATDDGYLAFATNVPGFNVLMASSPDLETWSVVREDRLPELPAWTASGKVWAPEVSARADGGFVLYFTSEDTASGRQCIGVATSGPDALFTAASDEPLVCPLDEGGAIDASTFTDDDGTRHLVWKNDGNCCGLDTWIQTAPLADDGLSLTGPPVRLVKQDLVWEGSLIEAPVIVKHADAYVLFYSANDYGGDDYAMGSATATALTGPYTKSDEPILSTSSSGGRYLGPGGQDVVSTPEGDRIVFHSWDESYAYRGMHVAPLEWDADLPRVVLPD
ncbi:MAG: glycoside hydrolase family 43 protein [Microbacterium sp.]